MNRYSIMNNRWPWRSRSRSLRSMLALILLLCLDGFVSADELAVEYQAEGKSYEGIYVKASTPKAPLVFIVHDWDGLTDYEIKRAHMLAELGYSAFAVDLFGKGVRPASIEENRRLTGELYADRKKMRSILTAAITEAGKQGADIHNAAVIGYCFGGAVVLELARSGADLKAFVSFHGGLETPAGQDYAAVNGKILILHGSADTNVGMAQFAKLAEDLEKASIPHEMITYSGAPHAFTVFASERYRKDADEKSWQRFCAFLGETLTK